MDIQPTSAPTAESAATVNPTAAAPVVNQAQAPQFQTQQQQQPLSEAERATLLGRINEMMSLKDKAINERDKSIAAQVDLQHQLTQMHNETQSSLTTAATAAQQAIDQVGQLKKELAAERSKTIKLQALLARPHLAPYAALIPEAGDEAQTTQVLDQLEQIRQADIERARASAPPVPAQPLAAPSAPAQQQDPTASLLQSLYGNRANLNPAFVLPGTPVTTAPGSTPAQMQPQGMSLTDTINQLYADARKAGTTEAFEDATRRAAVLAQSSYNR